MIRRRQLRAFARRWVRRTEAGRQSPPRSRAELAQLIGIWRQDILQDFRRQASAKNPGLGGQVARRGDRDPLGRDAQRYALTGGTK